MSNKISSMPRLILSLSLILTTPVFAQPTITSVTPSSGPVSGGTTVLIRGSGFDTTCPPAPQPCGRTSVRFGSIEATSFRVVDKETIEAISPPSFPGPANVGAAFPAGATYLGNAFTYTGKLDDAFGAKFYTFFSIWNVAGPDVPAFGLASAPCEGIGECVPPPGPRLTVLKARQGAPAGLFEPLGDPGYLFFIPKGAFDRLADALRVADLSRQDQSFGTRIPIVPERDFRDDFIALIDIPMMPHFRNTLRIYSLNPQTSVHIRVIRYNSTKIYSEIDADLGDPADMFHPGYAQLSDFGNVPPDSVRIEIEPRSPGSRIWAFATVTNNDTQQLTVVAPR